MRKRHLDHFNNFKKKKDTWLAASDPASPNFVLNKYKNEKKKDKY